MITVLHARKAAPLPQKHTSFHQILTCLAAICHILVTVRLLRPIQRGIVAFFDAKHVSFWQIILAGKVACYKVVKRRTQQIIVTFIGIMTSLPDLGHIAICVPAHVEKRVFVPLFLGCVMWAYLVWCIAAEQDMPSWFAWLHYARQGGKRSQEAEKLHAIKREACKRKNIKNRTELLKTEYSP